MLNLCCTLQIISHLGGANVAVSSSVLSPLTKVVVDEYVSDGKGGYKLGGMATELLTYLHR